jgi:hypothetical protein
MNILRKEFRSLQFSKTHAVLTCLRDAHGPAGSDDLAMILGATLFSNRCVLSGAHLVGHKRRTGEDLRATDNLGSIARVLSLYTIRGFVAISDALARGIYY